MPLKLMRPGEKLTWSHDWSNALASGDAPASRVWTIDPDYSPSLITDPTAATVEVTAPPAGIVCQLTETITSDNGVVDSEQLTIRCENE